MHYHILYACISHIGYVRSMNQDNFICDGRYMEPNGENIEAPLCGVKSSEDSPVFGIFDGMGGEECGEVASYLAAQDAAALEIGKDATAALAEFCQQTNADICDYANENEIFAMGTTAAMLAFTGKGVTLCNLGDSKVFRFSGGRLEQISKDHVAAVAFGRKPPLSQHLGIPPDEMIIEPYFAHSRCHDGDVYLLCSDGLTDLVSAEETTDVLAAAPIADAAGQLLKKALSNGGWDNITIILCKIERASKCFFKRKRSIQKKEA